MPAKARKAPSKRLRFEVFKRDHFACQYCGAQPPDVVLEADHIDPSAAGGPTTIDNLITACDRCNGGKSDKPLTVRQVRPDADLLYLETQQEIAELKRFQESLALREAEIDRVVETLQYQWGAVSGLEWCPRNYILRQLLTRYSPDIVLEAVRVVAPKVSGGYVAKDKWIPYLWGVARNTSQERELEVLSEGAEPNGRQQDDDDTVRVLDNRA